MYLSRFWIGSSLVFVFMYMEVVYLCNRYSSGNFMYKILSFKYEYLNESKYTHYLQTMVCAMMCSILREHRYDKF